jgi:hypothetical protein
MRPGKTGQAARELTANTLTDEGRLGECAVTLCTGDKNDAACVRLQAGICVDEKRRTQAAWVL